MLGQAGVEERLDRFADNVAAHLESLRSAVRNAEPLTLEEVERQHIADVLAKVGGNKSAAARILGVDRRTLARKGY